MLDLIAFDADDTLWENETLYHDAQNQLKKILQKYLPTHDLEARLYATEKRNLAHYGYGIKSFTLSMVETAIQLTGGRISAHEIERILGLGKAMLSAEVRLLPHVAETVSRLAQSYPLMVITKGDLLDQERKIERSGLGSLFTKIEVVSEKTSAVYAQLLQRHNLTPARFLMVGNSLRSDILPVVALGAHAVHIPYHLTWAHENEVGHLAQHNSYHTLEHIGQLPAFIQEQRWDTDSPNRTPAAPSIN